MCTPPQWIFHTTNIHKLLLIIIICQYVRSQEMYLKDHKVNIVEKERFTHVPLGKKLHLIPGRSIVPIHSFDNPAETSWSGRPELLAPSTQLFSPGKTLNILSDGNEISLKTLTFTVGKRWSSNISQLKSNLWQSDDDHTVILISSILRPLPTVLIRTFTCCSATETPTPWFRLCLASRRQRRWRASSIPRTSPSSRTVACLTARVRRSACGREEGQTSGSVTCWLFSACFYLHRKWWISNGSSRSSFHPSGTSERRSRGSPLTTTRLFLDFQRGSAGRKRPHFLAVITGQHCRCQRGQGGRWPAESWT